MMDYMRKVIYLKRREDKLQMPGQGFARLEKRKGYFLLHLSLHDIMLRGEQPIYIVHEQDGHFYASLIGTTGRQEQWDLRRPLAELPEGLLTEKICGILIGEEKQYLSGMCQGQPGVLSYEDIIFLPGEETESGPEHQETPVKVQAEAAEEEEKPGRGPEKESFLEGLAEMYPFEDDEIEWCFQMKPEDFNRFPMEYWHYAKNSFLLQGFYNYRHLVYAHTKEKNYIGVPGQFIRKEQYLAMRFGFRRFKQVRKKALSMGDYGYWMREL